ncbi:hypothetical protein BDZ97DRAFT_1828663 [Flammula alnicola]|nr:hypothetical protein BDZ97DRAFT_1828663 [Flammula alnicola]
MLRDSNISCSTAMSLIQTLPSTTDDFLLDGLSPAELFRYGRTCKDAYYTVNSYIRRRFQLDKLLERYFTPHETLRFRELQFQTGMFISGSTALQFFDRTVYPESDLDLYVEYRFREPIALWLAKIGYKYAPRPNSAIVSLEQALEVVPTGAPFIPYSRHVFHQTGAKGYFQSAFVLNFEKHNPYRKVQLITSHRSPFERILNFHSTCVMNIITHDKAYSLFPRGTFEERRSLIYIADNRCAAARAKYASRGWAQSRDITRDEFDDPRSAFSRGDRFPGDSKCWTMPILPKLDLPEGYMESNSWKVEYDRNLEPAMTYSVVLANKLKFSYIVVVDADLRDYISQVIPTATLHDRDQEENSKYDDEFRSLIRWHRADQI